MNKHTTERYTENFYLGNGIALVIVDGLFKEITIYMEGKELTIPSHAYADFMRVMEELPRIWRAENND